MIGRHFPLLALLFQCVAVLAGNINFGSTVKDQAGSPVEGAAVRLMAEGKESQADASGHYAIVSLATGTIDRSLTGSAGVAMQNARLTLSLPTPTLVTVSLFDTRGRLVAKTLDRVLPEGRHSLPVVDARVAAGVALVRVRAGGRTYVLKHLPIHRATTGSLEMGATTGELRMAALTSRVPSYEQVRAQAGQISDADLHNANCYYLSSEITGSVRNAWNAHYQKWYNVWNAPMTSLVLTANSKSLIQADAGWSQIPSIEPDGVLKFNHIPGWLSDATPYRNKKHVAIKILPIKETPELDHTGAFYLKENVDYESGLTFWQGGTQNWLRDANMHVAMFQTYANSVAAIYIGARGKPLRISGFIVPDQNNFDGTVKRFSYTVPDQSHTAIHVLKFRYRFGTSAYLRVYYNGVKISDTGTFGTKNYNNSWNYVFMNYSDYKPDGVTQIIYMDRIYQRVR